MIYYVYQWGRGVLDSHGTINEEGQRALGIILGDAQTISKQSLHSGQILLLDIIWISNVGIPFAFSVKSSNSK